LGANNGHHSPLLHGETNRILQFFEIDNDTRPDTRSCIFFTTHESCSLCLSAIAWTASPIVYYLFNYKETKDPLGIPAGVDILEEIFRVPAPSDTKQSLDPSRLYLYLT
jgi:tRNA(Arg) A34 adenosine deaminase TadA